MPSTTRSAAATAARVLTLLSLLGAAAVAHARLSPDQMSHEQLHRRASQTYSGCYKSAASMKSVGTYMYQSTGYCGEQCTGAKQAVMALTNGNDCWCGAELPSDDDKVDDSKCSTPCTGYGQDNCGGDDFFSVYLTGESSNVPKAGGDEAPASSSSSSSSSSSGGGGGSGEEPSATTGASTVVTSISPGQTVVVTVPATPNATPKSSSSSSSSSSNGGGGGTNTAGIAAGVVVGVAAVAAAVGGLLFWMRRKKQKEAEDEYRQKSSVSDFMRGGNERKPPGTGYSHMSDQRLDPEAGARRNSVGSLADNQDYSRRILRVANPDSS